MAKLKQFTVARVKNTGNFENVRTELTFELNEGENYQAAMVEAKLILDEAITTIITGKEGQRNVTT